MYLIPALQAGSLSYISHQCTDRCFTTSRSYLLLTVFHSGMYSLWFIPLELKNNQHGFYAELVEMNLLLVFVICVTHYSAILSSNLMIVLESQGLTSNNGIQKTWFIISCFHKIFAGIHSEFFIIIQSVGYKPHINFSLIQVCDSYGLYRFLIYIKFTASQSFLVSFGSLF